MSFAKRNLYNSVILAAKTDVPGVRVVKVKFVQMTPGIRCYITVYVYLQGI